MTDGEFTAARHANVYVCAAMPMRNLRHRGRSVCFPDGPCASSCTEHPGNFLPSRPRISPRGVRMKYLVERKTQNKGDAALKAPENESLPGNTSGGVAVASTRGMAVCPLRRRHINAARCASCWYEQGHRTVLQIKKDQCCAGSAVPPIAKGIGIDAHTPFVFGSKQGRVRVPVN